MKTTEEKQVEADVPRRNIAYLNLEINLLKARINRACKRRENCDAYDCAVYDAEAELDSHNRMELEIQLAHERTSLQRILES